MQGGVAALLDLHKEDFLLCFMQGRVVLLSSPGVLIYTCRENIETRRNGDVRYSIRYHVCFHVGSPSPQRDTFLSKRTVGSKFWLHSNCHNPSLRSFNTRRYTLLSRRQEGILACLGRYTT